MFWTTRGRCGTWGIVYGSAPVPPNTEIAVLTIISVILGGDMLVVRDWPRLKADAYMEHPDWSKLYIDRKYSFRY